MFELSLTPDNFLWGGGRVVMALCLGNLFFQNRSSKERGFDPRPPHRHLSNFFWCLNCLNKRFA